MPSMKAITVAELIELLKALPQDYEVTYDSGCANIYAEEIYVKEEDRKIVLNC